MGFLQQGNLMSYIFVLDNFVKSLKMQLNIFEQLSPNEIAIFIARNMNTLLKDETDYCVLYLNSGTNFLNIEKYYGERGTDYRKGDYPGDGAMEFYGPQDQDVVNFIVNLVIQDDYTTEENEEDFGQEKTKHINKLYNLIERGRIEGQMVLGRVGDSLINADIRKKIWRMTSQF